MPSALAATRLPFPPLSPAPWIQQTEGAKFWLSILTELRQPGVEDSLILCADGIKGMTEAVEAAFPKTIFSDRQRAHDSVIDTLRAVEEAQERI